MYGSVDDLVRASVRAERDRFVAEVFGNNDELPSPLVIASYPVFWQAITQVLLDPGPVDLGQLADGGPVGVIADRLRTRKPNRTEVLNTAIATAWAAAPLGALIFREPLQRGLGISDHDWAHCWDRLGARVSELANLDNFSPVPPPQPVNRTPTAADAGTRGRERLLSAAQELLATRLETSVTGRELAETAGVNYGLVNHYFGSKDAAFDEALTSLHRRFLTDILDVGAPELPGGAFSVFAAHRAFLRAWASRLIRDAATPEFELLGMERLMDRLIEAREITSRQKRRRLDATGDAMASVSLQLGWTILRPLPAAVDAPALAGIEAALQAVHRQLLDDPSL